MATKPTIPTADAEVITAALAKPAAAAVAGRLGVQLGGQLGATIDAIAQAVRGDQRAGDTLTELLGHDGLAVAAPHIAAAQARLGGRCPDCGEGLPDQSPEALATHQAGAYTCPGHPPSGRRAG